MGGSTSKKVLVARFDRETLAGFVNSQTYLRAEGVELLTPAGTVLVLPYGEVKTVSFVKDFERGEDRRDLRQFTTRPKMEGLWVRMRFRDGDVLDGLLSNNLLRWEPYGFTVVPPDPGAQKQRIFVPRAALAEVQVLGVVGSALRKTRKKPTAEGQIELFENNRPNGIEFFECPDIILCHAFSESGSREGVCGRKP